MYLAEHWVRTRRLTSGALDSKEFFSTWASTVLPVPAVLHDTSLERHRHQATAKD